MERPATCRDAGKHADERSADTDQAGAGRDSQAAADNGSAATIGYTQASATNAIRHDESANSNTDGYLQAGTNADGKAGGTDSDTNT